MRFLSSLVLSKKYCCAICYRAKKKKELIEHGASASFILFSVLCSVCERLSQMLFSLKARAPFSYGHWNFYLLNCQVWHFQWKVAHYIITFGSSPTSGLPAFPVFFVIQSLSLRTPHPYHCRLHLTFLST